MSEDTVANPQHTPRHLWAVGIVGLLWNAMGAFDYAMTQTQNEAYMGQFTAEELAYFYGFPAWVVATWAVAVWGGVLGTILLLLKKRLAVGVFLVALLAVVVTSVHNFLLSDGLEVMGVGGALFSALISAVALGLWVYARAMARRGVLA